MMAKIIIEVEDQGYDVSTKVMDLYILLETVLEYMFHSFTIVEEDVPRVRKED